MSGQRARGAHSVPRLRLLRGRAAQRRLPRRRLRHPGLHRGRGRRSLLRPDIRKMGLSAQRHAPAGGDQGRRGIQQKIPRLALQFLRLRRRGQLRRAVAKTARRTICSDSTRWPAAGGCALPRRTKRSGPSPPAPAKNPAPVVCFCTGTSVIFDYLSFKTFEDAFIALNRNGFDLYFENYSEGDINVYDYGLRPPRRRFEIEEHPLFSQGDQWS